MKKIVESFIIGGTAAGPSMPGYRLQSRIGKEISVDVKRQELLVPTQFGTLVARKGDKVCLYDDGTLGVRYGCVEVDA